MNYPWQATVQDDQGNAVVNPVVTVWEADGVTLATIYDVTGAEIANPVTGSLEGFVQFWVDEGEYRIEGASGGQETEVWSLVAGVNLSGIESKLDDLQDQIDYLSGVGVGPAEGVSSIVIDGDVQAVDTNGYYSAGDGGGAQYVRVSLEPSHAGKLQSADGAWWEMVEASPVNVKSFGAVNDNSTNNLAAFIDAISYAHAKGGLRVHIPAGVWAHDGGITTPINFRGLISGDGPGSTILRNTSGSANGITFSRDNYITSGGGLRDITVESGAGFATSGFFGDGSTGIGVLCSRVNDNFVLENVNVNNYNVGVVEECGWNARYENLQIMFHRYQGFLVKDHVTEGAGGSSVFSGGKISNNGYSGTDKLSSHSIEVISSGGFMFSNIDCTSAAVGIYIKPTAGKQVAYLFFNTVLADTTLSNGIVFDGSDGPVLACRMVNCWASFCDGNGLFTTGQYLDGLVMNGVALRQNKIRGWHHTSGINVYFNVGDIACNSRTNTNVYEGVRIEPDLFHWGIRDSRVGNFAGGGVISQGDSIYVGENSNYAHITNNNLSDFGSGKVGLNEPGSRPAERIVSGNI